MAAARPMRRLHTIRQCRLLRLQPTAAPKLPAVDHNLPLQHLTDLYKKRGPSSELEQGLPDDFSDHVGLLCEQIAALNPKQIVALRTLAQRLLIQNLPDWKPLIPRIWLFSYVAKQGLEAQHAARMRERIGDLTISSSP
jgi:hypothetical protein